MTKTRREKPTFIEEARRKQIVEAAIETIADSGYLNASLAEIAKSADISKGVISYHFESKDELVAATMNTILSDSYRYIKGRVTAAGTQRDKLIAYIEASFEYMQQNRSQFVALVDLWGSFSSFEGKKHYSSIAYDPCRRHLTNILEPGQAGGEFRGFPASTLASIIQAAIDGIMLQWVFDPETVNLEECSREIAAIFDHYTRME